MHQLPTKKYAKPWFIWQSADEVQKVPTARLSQAVTKKTTFFPSYTPQPGPHPKPSESVP